MAPQTTPAKKHTLLIVDDEIDVCDSVHDLLRRQFHVLRAANAEQALALMRDNEVHIILTDQRMPKVTGVEFLSSARDGHPQAVRMLYTGYADFESIVAAINQGHIYRFLKKPWQPDELESAVRDAAEEYERIIEQTTQMGHLRNEVQKLHHRVTSLEEEIKRLRN